MRRGRYPHPWRAAALDRAQRQRTRDRVAPRHPGLHGHARQRRRVDGPVGQQSAPRTRQGSPSSSSSEDAERPTASTPSCKSSTSSAHDERRLPGTGPRRAPAPPAACGHSASLSSWSASWSSTPSSTNCADRLADGGAEQVAADRPLASYRADLSPGHEPRRFCHGHIVSLQYAAEAVPAGGRRHRIVPLVTRLVTGVRSDIFPGSPWNNRSQRSGRLLA